MHSRTLSDLCRKKIKLLQSTMDKADIGTEKMLDVMIVTLLVESAKKEEANNPQYKVLSGAISGAYKAAYDLKQPGCPLAINLCEQLFYDLLKPTTLKAKERTMLAKYYAHIFINFGLNAAAQNKGKSK